MELTFEQLPQAVSRLYTKLEDIERLLSTKSQATHQEPELPISIQEAADVVGLCVPTIYGLVSKSKIPFSKKGKRLYFFKNQLLEWIKAGRNITASELQSELDTYLHSKYKRV